MTAVKHPTRKVVLAKARTIFTAKNLKVDTNSSRSDSPAAIGGSSMQFRVWFRKAKPYRERLTNREFELLAEEIQAAIGNKFVVSLSRTNKINVEYNLK